MSVKKRRGITVSFDKLDDEFLADLRKRTGKSDQQLIKLALARMHQDLCEGSTTDPSLSFTSKHDVHLPAQVPLPEIVFVPPVTISDSSVTVTALDRLEE